jgi:hypothetical protein
MTVPRRLDSGPAEFCPHEAVAASTTRAAAMLLLSVILKLLDYEMVGNTLGGS